MLMNLQKDNLINRIYVALLWYLMLAIVLAEDYLISAMWMALIIIISHYEICTLNKLPLHHIIRDLLLAAICANLIACSLMWYTLFSQWSELLLKSLSISLSYKLFCLALSIGAVIWRNHVLNKIALACLLAMMPIECIIASYYDIQFWQIAHTMLFFIFVFYILFFVLLFVFLYLNDNKIYTTIAMHEDYSARNVFKKLQLELVLWGFLCLILTIFAFCFMKLLEQNNPLLFSAVFLVMICDVFAYIIGKTVGGRKIYASISSNKTYAGSIGSIIVAVLVAVIMYFVKLDMHYFPFITRNVIGINFIFLIFYVIILALLSQAGDLLISFYKRRVHKKNTGSIMLSHGGLLDRLDSMLLSVTFSYLIFYYFIP